MKTNGDEKKQKTINPAAEMEAETTVVKVDQFVVPGDIVGRILTDVKLGPGLLQDNSNLIATKAGVVQHRPPNKYWIENSQKRVTNN